MSEKGIVISSFSLSIIALLVIGIYSLRNLQQYKDASRSIGHSRDVIFESHNILAYLQSIETSHRGYVITGKAKYLRPRREALSKVKASILKLQFLSSDNPISTSLCDSLNKLVEMKITHSLEIIAAYQEGGFEEAREIIATDSSKIIMDRSRVLMDAIIKNERVRLSEYLEDSSEKFRASVNIIAINILSAIAIILTAVLFIFKNISGRIQKDMQLRVYTKELEVKNLELSQFIKISSHDLKEPIKTISNYTELLKEQYGSSFEKQVLTYLNRISYSATRMKKLMDGLLEYVQIDGNAHIEDVDCNIILKEALQALEDDLRQFNPMISADKLPVIRGYRGELVLLFKNIISNAIKFRNPNVRLEINITAADREREWVFAVKDNGIGIDKKYQEQIFVIFGRLHNRDEYAGTGIGLALCNKIVKIRGGKIWVDSEPGVGSTFYFTIPK